ncbi:MAG TPA: isocitrate lyase/phosphoenolpyruvate mutase family protein [Acetobacteraceae bacterium]|nr:isocitrate lyase/phosphoenolpyruvate mutase family protein [Acetobacteraceae bacterium]
MITDHAERCAAFQALHDRRELFVIPNPWDAGSARILEHEGFRALATTSAGLAFSLGRRDGMVRRDEALDNARAIVEATSLPVSADLENCYGHDPATVAETIRLAFATGLAGGSVEDASGDEADPIYARDHAIARVEAAVAAARSLPHKFTLTARAEGFLHGRGDLQEIIARLQAFERAGADVVYAPGLPDLEAVRAVVQAVRCPVNVLIPGRNPFTSAQLQAIGVVRISVGALLSRAALGAVFRAAREMQQHGTFNWVNDTPPTSEVAACMRGR